MTTEQRGRTALRHPKTARSRDPRYTILVPIFNEEVAEWRVRLALDLAQGQQGQVVLVGMVRVPAGDSLSTGAVEAQAVRARLEQLRALFESDPIRIKPRIRVEHEPWRALVRVVNEEQAVMVVVPWARDGASQFFAVGIDELLDRLAAHVVVVDKAPPGRLRRILLPLRGSDEAPLMLEVALSLARAANTRVTLLHANHEHEEPARREIYAEVVRMSQGHRWIEREVRVDDALLPAILSRADQHDLLVLGASASADDGGARVGAVARHLAHEEQMPLVVVKSHRPIALPNLAQWDRARRLPATPASVVVEKWFAENTFSSTEFADIERLCALKEAQGLTISLGLPALNEEETVGRVIQVVRAALMEAVPLLDEIVLIDSGSTDRTVEIARDLGVPVHQHNELLANYGSYRGKGEALWKSLHVLRGDLIAWIDTDIANIHPRFVYGVLGPLLRHDTIQYVKGFYRRPLKVGDTLQAGGGGRVTELVARPWINLFYPELSGIVQPLSGEYAGRRWALERVPFYTGYGVETGLLLDLVERYGISGIAQVDLLTRIHHNQTLGALSRMAFAIQQVFIDHLEQRQKARLLSDINRTMKIIRYEPGRFSLEEQVITDHRRPPIIELPEYRAAHPSRRAPAITGQGVPA